MFSGPRPGGEGSPERDGDRDADADLVDRRDNFLDPDGTAVTLTMELARKDLRLIAELAERTGSPMPQSALSLATIEDSIAAGLDGRDMADVAVHLRRSAEHG